MLDDKFFDLEFIFEVKSWTEKLFRIGDNGNIYYLKGPQLFLFFGMGENKLCPLDISKDVS